MGNNRGLGTCRSCKQTPARYTNYLCRECNARKARESRARNRTKPCVDCGAERNSYSCRCTPCVVKKNNEWKTKNPEKKKRHDRNARLKHQYGITIDQYEKMVRQQGGKCAICRQAPLKELLQVDHHHASGKRRGLLCRRCNLMLGYIEDQLPTLKRALSYLGVHV